MGVSGSGHWEGGEGVECERLGGGKVGGGFEARNNGTISGLYYDKFPPVPTVSTHDTGMGTLILK